MPFSGPFDLSLGGYTVTPGQGSPPPVDLGAYTVFPGGGQVGAPGLGFGPSTAAFNPGAGFFEGAVSGAPESVTGAISGPGTPSLGSAPGQATAPGVGSVSGSPNGITVSPFSSGMLGDINAINANTPTARAIAALGLRGPAATAANLGVNAAMSSVQGLGLANFALGALGPKGEVSPETASQLYGPVAQIEAFLNAPPTPQAFTPTPDDPSVGTTTPSLGPTGLAGLPTVNVGPLGTAGPAIAGVSAPNTVGSSISLGPTGPAFGGELGQVSQYSGFPTVNFAAGAPTGPVGSTGVQGGTTANEPDTTEGGPASTGPVGGPSGPNAPDAPGPAGAPAGTPGGEEGAAGGTAGDGPSIICAELYRQGLMDEPTYQADEAFGAYLRRYDPAVLIGYHRWARPVVAVMRRSRLVTRGVWLIAKPWAQAMAGQTNRVGSVLMAVGLPLCRLVGQIEARAGRGVACGPLFAARRPRGMTDRGGLR